jgi:hypothetical protein
MGSLPASDSMRLRSGPADDSAEELGDDVPLRAHSSSRQRADNGGGGFCSKKIVAAVGSFICVVVILAHGLLQEWTDASDLHAVTWNIAAINNNPFEYWITHDDADYNKLMVDVQDFISSPAARDVAVDSVFTPAMYAELRALMAARGWTGLAKVDEIWSSDFSKRKIISGFMLDKSLGDKRLASMPDRVTNTINTQGGGAAFRPTVINCFDGDLTTLANWWSAWKRFMFEPSFTLPGASAPTAGSSMLGKIKRAKYPAVTEVEEAVSLPLQTVAQAVFDAVLVHIVNSVSPGGKWGRLRKGMCEALNRKKDERTLAILAGTYSSASVIFLQEVAGSFVAKAEAHDELGSRHTVVRSASLDKKRDQNSLILLRRTFFREDSVTEHTGAVMSSFSKDVPVANGDLLVASAEDVLGRKYLLASFHGDTNGLATIPVVQAVHKLALTMPDHVLLFGMDANTHTIAVPAKKQGVDDFAAAFRGLGYSSCWGDQPDPHSATTFNARTYLQPQLQKAARADEKESKGDRNPKDFILFPKGRFAIQRVGKDNTGGGRFVENMVFPTLSFPSDHGIVSTSLKVHGGGAD